MVWGRAGWTGSQRCPIQWGGEPQSDWEGLAASIRGGLSWGMSGVPYHSSDIGGFYGSDAAVAGALRALAAGRGVRSHMRLARRSASASRGLSAPRPRRSRASGSRSATVSFPISSGVIAEAVATGMPVMRAMALAFPGNALTRSLRNAIHVRRHAAGRADRPRGRRSRGRAASRRRGTTSIRASAFRVSACCATRPRSTSSRCSAAKAMRCRSAAPSSIPARSTPRIRSSNCGCSGARPARSTASRRRRSRPGPTAHSRFARRANVKVEPFGDAAGIDVGVLGAG